MNSSLLLQQCPVCLVRLTWILFVKVGRWPYSCCFVGRCLQDLFNTARSIISHPHIDIIYFLVIYRVRKQNYNNNNKPLYYKRRLIFILKIDNKIRR